MEEDPDLKLEDALAHAIWAKNMEIGRHGLSPYQIVYGKSPFLPGISEGTPVSDGVVSDADVIRKHFERQELARSTIRRLDSSRRIKDALKARIQDYHDQDYETGDRIIFEDENGQWKGPAVVQGKESKTLWIVHNGNMRKVAICKARHWEDEPEQIEDSDESNDEPTDDEEIIVISEEVDDTAIESESIEKTKDVDDKQESSTRLEKSDDERESSTRLESYDDKQESSTRLENVEDVQESSNWMDDMTTTRARPKRGSEVEFRKLHEDEIKFGRVKHVGKMGGKKKNTCWIVYKDGKEEELDFLKEVEGWKYTKPEQSVNFDHQTNFTVSETTGTDTFMEAEGVFHMTRNEPQEVLAAVVPASEYNHHEVQAAMKEELEKWIKFGAYEVHEDIGQERIDTRWMILRKETHDGLKVNVKARLCLRGFKETEKPRSDSPTVDRISNKILYAIAGNEGWKIETIDVTSAFLQGEDIDREVFVTPPKEADMKGMIWKMVKSGYGLYDAGRKWWIKVIESMIKLGGRTL